MQRRPARGKSSGQILVLMALLSTTMIIFFGMVVSIGHLVQAKINLQNAVDLAAMTGASYQARYLNAIALINYRMRQNYKFTLYDLYITQSRFNAGFRSVISGSSSTFKKVDPSPSNLIFGICQQYKNYAPRVPGEPGNAAAEDTDLCQNATGGGLTIPEIIPSPVVNANPAVIAANEAIKALSAQAKQTCRNSADQNRWYLENYIMPQLARRQETQAEALLQVLINFNRAFSNSSDEEELSSQREADAAMRLTFFQNLITANRDARISLINPVDNRAFQIGGVLSPEQFKKDLLESQSLPAYFSRYFKRQMASFRMYVINFRVAGGCVTELLQAQYPQAGSTSPGVFLGLSRSRNGDPGDSGGNTPDAVQIPFNIVLKATVQPKILFWPTSLTPSFTAVAAAKPFGSRIAPAIKLVNLETCGFENCSSSSGPNAAFANMAFYPGDWGKNSTQLPGIGHVRIMQALASNLNLNNGDNDLRPSIIQAPGFMQMALSPTLHEGLFWNPFLFLANNEPGPALNDPLFSGSARSLRALFPSLSFVPEVIRNGAGYQLPDRMPSGFNFSSSQLAAWHETELIGESRPEFRNNGPVFFADRGSLLSSWAPTINPTPDETALWSSYGRMGYQIKLTSLQQVCREINDGGVASSSMRGFLEKSCDVTDPEAVFH